MQLLLYAAAFVLWECTVKLSGSAVVVGSRLGRGWVTRGPGYRIQSPWPGDLSLVLEAASAERGYSLEEFRTALAAARRDTRTLRVCCEGYLLFVFAGMPAVIRWLGAEGAWLWALPIIGAFQIGTLAVLYATQRRGGPPPERRIERWIGSALFPPALFRTPTELVAQRLAGFHPATAAAAILDEHAFVRMLRQEIGRRGPERGATEPLLSLCEQRGIERSRVLAPARVGPEAASYCPLCLDEFLVERGRCCGVDSIVYPGSRPD